MTATQTDHWAGADPLARLAALGGWRRLAASALTGAALSFAQPPYGLWPLIFVSVPALAAMGLGARTGRGAFAAGWGAGTGFFAAGLYWVAEAFMVDASRDGWMAPFAIFFLATGLALFWGAAFWIAHRVARPAERGGVWGTIALAAAWTLLEFMRAHVLTGFPWALPAYVWVDTPAMQAAALIGPHGVGFLTLLAAALPVAIQPGRLTTLAPAALAVAAIGGFWLWGAARLAAPLVGEDGAPLIRIVQPNVPQTEKWKPENARWIFNRLLELTAREGAPDIVLWPETAVPFYIEREDPAREMIAAELPEGAALILGSLRAERTADGARSPRNSVVVLDGAGRPVVHYDKRHLVPFGEYLPLKEVFGALGMTALVDTRGGFGVGDHVGPVAAPGVPPFTPLICYEAIFPHEVAAASEGARWLVQITNDAWFGASIGPPQHLAQARVRAIETGLPMARAANTGISAMIGPRGEVLASLALGETGEIDAPLPPRLLPPPYFRLGDWPVISAVFFALMAAGLAARRRRARSSAR